MVLNFSVLPLFFQCSVSSRSSGNYSSLSCMNRVQCTMFRWPDCMHTSQNDYFRLYFPSSTIFKFTKRQNLLNLQHSTVNAMMQNYYQALVSSNVANYEYDGCNMLRECNGSRKVCRRGVRCNPTNLSLT